MHLFQLLQLCQGLAVPILLSSGFLRLVVCRIVSRLSDSGLGLSCWLGAIAGSSLPKEKCFNVIPCLTPAFGQREQ